jgi:Uma2 family endonuclease
VEDLVLIFCEEFDLRIEKFGSATWLRSLLKRGIEPDTSFYVKNASRIAGKREIDLETDPPPDICVEIDITSDSLNKFPIYALLSVPELWVYNGETCRFFALSDDGRYSETPVSRFLPLLTGRMIADALNVGKFQSQDEARNTFRLRIRALL